MNNKEVYINGTLLDLDEANNPIQLIYSVNDLAELKDRQAYSTNTFKVPKTENNLAACGYPDSAALIQVQPYRRNAAKVVQGGIEVLTNGIAIISAASGDIEIQVLSGLVGFFDSLGDKNIRDLDLSFWDHVWDLPTVAGSQGNTDGYVYSVIDYGGLSLTTREADARQLRPASFRKTIIEAIIAEAGYTATGLCFSYPKYLDSLVPFTNDNFTHGDAFAKFLKGFYGYAKSLTAFTVPAGDLESNLPLPDHAASDPQNQWDGGALFTAATDMRVSAAFKYSIDQMDNFFGSSAPEIVMFIDKLSGGVWSPIAQNITTVTEPMFVTQHFVDQQINAEVDLLSGEKLRVRILQQPAAGRQYAVVLAGAEMKVDPIVENVIYGSQVQLAASLPDISQKNFFKDFLQNFGLIVIPDNYRQNLLLINLEEVYANKPNAEDITTKLVDSPDGVVYSFGNYGINNFAKYRSDDAVPTDTGTGVLVFDNLTLDQNVTIIDSVFAASVTVYRMGGVAVTEIKKIEDITKSSDFKTKTSPRILLNVLLNTGFKFFDANGEISVTAISLPTFNGLGYQKLFDENYPEFLQMMYRPFIVDKEILFSETDIAKIDWRIPVYDKKSAAYYYKNNIVYVQGDVCTMRLIRMPGIPVPEVVPVTIDWINKEVAGELDIDIVIYKNGQFAAGSIFPEGGTFTANVGDEIRVLVTSVSGAPVELTRLLALLIFDVLGVIHADDTPGVPGAVIDWTFTCQPGKTYYNIEAYQLGVI